MEKTVDFFFQILYYY